MIGDKTSREYGDYQTPQEFVGRVCKYLKETLKIMPNVIFEPTFGIGGFLKEGIRVFSNISKAYGVEINSSYFAVTKSELTKMNNNTDIKLFNQDIFEFNFDIVKENISKSDNILILGNPPWVTNSDLSSIGSANSPIKKNFKNFKGLDAITGKGNFDVAEFIILQLLKEFSGYDCYVAMLCKNIVARNILRELPNYNFHLSDIKLLTFEALDVFNVSCDAGLLVMKLCDKRDSKLICDVYDFEMPTKKIRSFGWVDNCFISNIESYYISSSIDGKSPFVWRQGIKHDCSKVMELCFDDEISSLKNGFDDAVEIEDGFVFELLKSSDLKNKVITTSKRRLIVTQRKPKEDTNNLKLLAPKLWCYLNKYENLLDNRKSSIYKNSPRFSIFGIGEYSFARYKIAISGFYKEPNFALVYSNRPIMLDDTCYILPFNDYKIALITLLLLSSNIVMSFIKSIAFLDSKRPYTKEILMRIDIYKVYEIITYDDLERIAVSNGIKYDISKDDYSNYIINALADSNKLF